MAQLYHLAEICKCPLRQYLRIKPFRSLGPRTKPLMRSSAAFFTDLFISRCTTRFSTSKGGSLSDVPVDFKQAAEIALAGRNENVARLSASARSIIRDVACCRGACNKVDLFATQFYQIQWSARIIWYVPDQVTCALSPSWCVTNPDCIQIRSVSRRDRHEDSAKDFRSVSYHLNHLTAGFIKLCRSPSGTNGRFSLRSLGSLKSFSTLKRQQLSVCFTIKPRHPAC